MVFNLVKKINEVNFGFRKEMIGSGRRMRRRPRRRRKRKKTGAGGGNR